MGFHQWCERAVIWTLAAAAASGVAACGAGDGTTPPTSGVAAASVSPSAASGSTPAAPTFTPAVPTAPGPSGTLTLTGAIAETVTGVAPVTGLVCEMAIGDVSGHLPSGEAVMLAWGNITEAITDFPGSSAGAFVSFSRVLGGSWRVNADLSNGSGTLTMSGSGGSLQVSIDLSLASTSVAGSSLHVRGSFAC